MSFSRRLQAALLLILIVPLGAIALLLIALPGESREGNADARVAGALPGVLADYEAEIETARTVALGLARDPSFVAAIEREDLGRLQEHVQRLVRQRSPALIEVRSSSSGQLVRAADGEPVATVSVAVRSRRGPIGRVLVSTLEAQKFVEAAASSSDQRALVADEDGVVATDPATAADGGAEDVDLGGKLPRSTDLKIGSEDLRARVEELPDAARELRLALAGPLGSSELTGGQVLVGILLGAFALISAALIVPLIRDLQRTHERTAEQAVTDPLTGLSNRRQFREALDREIARARRFEHPLSLLMLDLDDFKRVNDSHGHVNGDRVLREMARAMVAESRGVDEPARYGGEEFVFLLPETDIQGAIEMAERVGVRIGNTPIELDRGGGTINVTISVGAAGTPDTELDARALIEAADAALYEAKRAGKNRVCRAPPRGA